MALAGEPPWLGTCDGAAGALGQPGKSLKFIHVAGTNGKGYKGLEINLLGSYQTQNAAVAVTVCQALQRRNGWNISETAIRLGLATAQWPARFEILRTNPWFIVDGGHNPQCVDSLVDNLNTYFPNRKVTFITGVMADKDYETMFRKIVPLAKRVFTVAPNNPRALSAEKLAQFFEQQGVSSAKPCNSIEQCVTEAMQTMNEQEVICAFGSFYMAGDIRRMLGKT